MSILLVTRSEPQIVLHYTPRGESWFGVRSLRHTVKFFNGVGDPVGRYPRLYLRRAVLFRQSRGNVRRS